MEQKSAYSLLEKILVLKRCPMFAMVNTSDLQPVAAIAEELYFVQGDTIVGEGDIGDSLYLIKNGTVQVSKRVGMHGSTVLAELARGDCFGEMSAIDEEVRSASVIARETCSLLRLNKDDLFEVILECPHIGLELLKIFVKRLRSANTLIESLSCKSLQSQDGQE